MQTTTETPNIETLTQTLGLILTSSQPRPYIDKDWHALAYDCVLLRNGKPVWEGEYKLGVGHVKPKHWRGASVARWFPEFAAHTAVIITLGKNPHARLSNRDAHARAAVAVAGHYKIAPSLPDVLYSLLTDGEADFQAMSFGEWCSNFGYDSDSRKAHATYEACCEVGRKLRRAFTPEELQTLTETLANY